VPQADFWALRTGAAEFEEYNWFVEHSGGNTFAPAVDWYTEAHLARYHLLNSFAFSPEPQYGLPFSTIAFGTPQTFESLSGASSPLIYTDTGSGTQVTLNYGPGSSFADLPVGTMSFGRYSTAYSDDGQAPYIPSNGGGKFIAVGGGEGDAMLTIEFNKLLVSFSSYWTDYADFNGRATLEFYRGATLVKTEVVDPLAGDPPQPIPPDFPGSPTTSFLDRSAGFVGHTAKTAAAAFDKIVLRLTTPGSETIGMDNFTVGTVGQITAVYVSVGQSIQFTDTSTNSPTSWLWNFGDSTTSTLQNPTKSYSTAGTRAVTLTATNANGSGSITKTGYVIVT
jgi:hypothetical protein